MIVSNLYCYVYLTIHLAYTYKVQNINGISVPTVHFTVLNINFRELDYVVNEGDQQRSIILRLRETQNSFTLTLHPVTITEARDPDGFNVSLFVADVPPDAQATGKEVVPSQKYINTYL